MNPAWGFEIFQVEALEQDKGDKESQDKIDDSGGVMFKAVIQSPVGGEGVEEVIFDIPSTMACLPKLITWKLRKREGGGPPPMMIIDGFDPLFADTLSPGDGLIGMKYPERDLDSFGRVKPFRVPELSQSSRLVPKTGSHLGKQALCILKQGSLIPLDDSDDMLSMVDTEIEKGGFEIERISDHPIDETSITLEDTL